MLLHKTRQLGIDYNTGSSNESKLASAKVNGCKTIKIYPDQVGPSLLPFVFDPNQSVANAFLLVCLGQSSPAPLCIQVM